MKKKKTASGRSDCPAKISYGNKIETIFWHFFLPGVKSMDRIQLVLASFQDLRTSSKTFINYIIFHNYIFGENTEQFCNLRKTTYQNESFTHMQWKHIWCCHLNEKSCVLSIFFYKTNKLR